MGENGVLRQKVRFPSLIAEGDGLTLCIHRFYDSKRLKLITEISDYSAAELEALFDSYSDTLDSRACRLGNRDKALKRTAVCQKVVNYENLIALREEPF